MQAKQLTQLQSGGATGAEPEGTLQWTMEPEIHFVASQVVSPTRARGLVSYIPKFWPAIVRVRPSEAAGELLAVANLITAASNVNKP